MIGRLEKRPPARLRPDDVTFVLPGRSLVCCFYPIRLPMGRLRPLAGREQKRTDPDNILYVSELRLPIEVAHQQTGRY
jgi:hypothetical protein